MSMAPPSEYEADAARIDREYVPDSATTKAEVDRALQQAGFPNASQGHISDWLVGEEDVWPEVGGNVQDADSIRRVIDSESAGTVSSGRASQIADSINSEIQSARREASQNVTTGSDGTVRNSDGSTFGKFNNVEEEVRSDGIYYRNTNTGNELKAAGFNR